MQFLVLLPLLLLLWVDGLSGAYRCLLYQERCTTHCPRGMHAYHTRCDRDTMSQRTCAFPYVYTLGFTCGWSRCDCNNDLVLDDNLGVCVKQDECPEKNSKTSKPRPRARINKYRPKKLRLKEAEEEDIITSMI